jgi:hypothetical protein
MGGHSLSTLTRATFTLVALAIAVTAVLSAAGTLASRRQGPARELNRMLARKLRLTDLALAPGTSYTRHPSQADLFAPHGDHPSAIEHFPAGSVLPPPTNPIGPSPLAGSARASHQPGLRGGESCASAVIP